MHATVELVEPRGHDSLLHLRLDSPGAESVLAVIAGGAAAPPAGAHVFLTLPVDRRHLFDGRTGARLA